MRCAFLTSPVTPLLRCSSNYGLYYIYLQPCISPIIGTPENEAQALELARNNPHAFEEWCVTHVLKFKSNERRGGDGGIDGTFRFPTGMERGRQIYGKAVAQVKGGSYTLSHVHDFRTAMQNTEADVSVFVVTRPPTRGMQTEAARAGHTTYTYPFLDVDIPVHISILQYLRLPTNTN